MMEVKLIFLTLALMGVTSLSAESVSPPADVAARIGVTHTGGRYSFGDEPYIIEGARRANDLGFKVIKFFIGHDMNRSFPYNSKWDKAEDLVEVMEHPYFDEVFELDFNTVILNVSDTEKQMMESSPDFTKSSREIYDLTQYLMRRFRDRDITFIIKNWEGDWLLRGNFKNRREWVDETPQSEIDLRVKNFTKWIEARQKAVSDARRKFKGASKCRVYLAVEANKVIESAMGVPGIANLVLPNVEVDMVSWSSYDGMKTTKEFRRGIEYLKANHRPTGAYKGDVAVMIGEIGIPEQRETPEEMIVPRWRDLLAVCWEQNIPYVVHWELYCNEPKDKSKNPYPQRTAEEMNGFWIVKPDGSLSIGGEYIVSLLK